MFILSNIFGFLALAAYLCGATGFMGLSRATGAVMTGVFMMLSLALIIGAIMKRDRLKKTHDLP